MATLTVKSFDQIMSDMTAYILANAPQITDLTPGSIIRSFLESSATSIEEVYVSVYLGFQRALQTVAPDKFSFARQTGTYASASVVFTAAVAPSQNIIIPLGTRVQTSSGLLFDTTIQGVILSGQTTSGSIGVTAEHIGTIYNVGAGAINTMKDDVNGVNSVSNALAAAGGTDAESDFSYQNRFQLYIEGLAGSNQAGLLGAALAISGITSASIVENFPPVSNVNAYLYIDNGSPTGTPAALVTQVQTAIDGDGTTANPGYRSAGVNVVVVASTILSQNFTLSVTPTNQNVDTSTLITDVKTAITNYVNNLAIGKNIIFAEVIASVMGVFGAYNVSFSVPTGDVTVSSNQAARVGTITVTIV